MAMSVTSTSGTSNYHVFLSFRGEDTRHGFTGNLYKALTYKGIHTFIDDEELQSGEQIKPALVMAIQKSRIAIIVLSQNYATSSFCLDELVAINDRRTKGLLVVIPVFIKVDPSDVRHHKGSYGDALAKHEIRLKHNMDRLLKWKEALRQVADLSGFHFKQGDGYEYKFIERIIDRVSQKINHPARLHVADHPVGLESRVAQVMKLLDVGSDNGVHMVGILGMGGIGKSTLARAVYNKLIAQSFDGCCYLGNVREESEKHGPEHLQNILLQKILRDDKIKVTSVEEGAWKIPERLKRKKVLLVLDDVDKVEQLKAIVGSAEWFGPGSRVIITTRDQQPLACHQVKRIYEVKTLNLNDARKMLTWKAFKKEKADPNYEKVLDLVLTYAYGLPLALEVIGSHLSGKSIEDWESAINKYKRNPPQKIQDILKVSFDTLGEEEKSVFLDIVCCMKGYGLKEVEAMLRVLYDASMKYHIGVLIDKSLVKVKSSIWDDTVEMHDLIQEMGRQIDHKESHKKPQKRKRLWLWKDIIEVLKQNKEASTIEIIHLDVPVSNREEIIEWDGNGFKVMKNLKILIIKNGKFSEGPKCLPNSLRVLEWWEYPSNCLPSDFQPQNFVMCNLPHSCFTSFSLDHSSKMFKNLTVLKFDECKSLTRTPDLSDFPNLEELSFKWCYNLVTVHESIGHLGKVKEISARGCMKLRSFPPIHLTSLEKLDLSDTGLVSFPEISGKMENIRELQLSDPNIDELPISFVNLVRLQSLLIITNAFSGPSSVLKIPSSILMMPELTEFTAIGREGLEWVKEEENEKIIVSSNLNDLYLSACNLDDDFFSVDFRELSHVTSLNLSWNNFTFLPECIKEFQSLRSLDVSYCESLKEIRGVPPNIKYFDARGCESLSSSSISMFMNQELYEAGMTDCRLPRVRIPEWFDKKSRGTSTCFWFRNKLPTNILCLLISIKGQATPVMFINGKKYDSDSDSNFDSNFNSSWEDMGHTFIYKLRLQSSEYEMVLEKEWNHAEVTYESRTSEIKGTGIRVFKRESREEDIRFSDPCRKRKSREEDIRFSDLNRFELDINRLLKRRRYVEMEEQNEEQQKCIVSCLLDWACTYIPTQSSHCIIM